MKDLRTHVGSFAQETFSVSDAIHFFIVKKRKRKGDDEQINEIQNWVKKKEESGKTRREESLGQSISNNERIYAGNKRMSR